MSALDGGRWCDAGGVRVFLYGNSEAGDAMVGDLLHGRGWEVYTDFGALWDSGPETGDDGEACAEASMRRLLEAGR